MSALPQKLHGIWEERWHPLREEWIVIAAHRQNRPWNGATVADTPIAVPAYLSDCYLCPGNRRTGGLVNPEYQTTFVFDNDHPCVGPAAPDEELLEPARGPNRVRAARGHARVICFSPQHNLTLAELSHTHITEIIQIWQQQTTDLGNRSDIKHVLCFENKGEIVGVSNPHPHGQIYATNFVFKTIEQELAASIAYSHEHQRTLFTDIIAAEQADGRRILYEDEHIIAFVPYFARYAYEVYIAPKRRLSHIFHMTDVEVISLAHALKAVTIRFDNLWQMSFPYVMSLHQAPTDGGDYNFYHFFIAFHPPLRRPDVAKFLAGPEIGGGNFISDTSPEAKAAELLAVSGIAHYHQAERLHG
ncbi:galactose-1-phosphate uridylyltransferase [Tengunoibacter tsumagoiensis]|uniref:Galactose-1-phosphate uridylyltransferase n=1 Tax=Tengunoibacter tsumagoiensis TaxID=2014871 RepID=A0A402A3L8_9CHLR|nr:galactose-1-phosphate uridylyltransferase [Tengunoibacter tsumagoiensis]GCE13758.1 galactose-1-phosphate uridylyltransferase [Tengunoibacter tsumagoiensis]